MSITFSKSTGEVGFAQFKTSQHPEYRSEIHRAVVRSANNNLCARKYKLCSKACKQLLAESPEATPILRARAHLMLSVVHIITGKGREVAASAKHLRAASKSFVRCEKKEVATADNEFRTDMFELEEALKRVEVLEMTHILESVLFGSAESGAGTVEDAEASIPTHVKMPSHTNTAVQDGNFYVDEDTNDDMGDETGAEHDNEEEAAGGNELIVDGIHSESLQTLIFGPLDNHGTEYF